MRISQWTLSNLALVLPSVLALQVTPDSECAALCSDGSNSTLNDANTITTNSSDIVCGDEEYSETGNGIRFKNCLNCLQKSDSTWKEQSDVFWFLYNVRYAFDVCLYSYPDPVSSGTTNSPCNIETSCGSLEDALTTSLLKTNADNQFDYCKADDSIIKSSSYKECISCLKSTSDQKYLANFLVALRAGCMQEPGQGDIIGLSGTIFTASLVNITDPNTNETLPGDGGAPVGSMTTGTIVGIAVGCGLGLAGLGWLLFMYCRRSRQRRGAGIKIESPPPDTPMNHRSMYGIQKSSYFQDLPHGRRPPLIHDPARGHMRTMSNAQHYDSIERDMMNSHPHVSYHYAPHSKSNGPNAALPTHPAYIPRVVSKLPEPRTAFNPRKTHAPDSYALQTYLNATDDFGKGLGLANDASSSGTVSSRNPSPARQEDSTPFVAAPAPMPNSKAARPRLPSLSFPSLHKLIIPKDQAHPPPEVTLVSPTPTSAVDANPYRELRISKPLAVLETRFQDKPLGGGPVMADSAPSGFNEEYLKRREANKSPMLSGNSRVYG
ncbi:exo-alpha-sialidase neuraminidase [Fusarium heterosporum]|uniref:Exo-alpha-sialidase neuraminidase n=1 Tax=Fusarium heterosporum TaxID=42747 RepID=A0A8H5SY52_FUSHE|nr:exo-alpha-sialidase neuraminidase [Fusarium heterosporum]